jgi:KaiC/GvpD/RAD55 family RecA-like ATPase
METIPYKDISSELLNSIFDGLSLCYEKLYKDKGINEIIEKNKNVLAEKVDKEVEKGLIKKIEELEEDRKFIGSLNNNFRWVYNKYHLHSGPNRHLVEGMLQEEKAEQDNFCRLSLILWNEVKKISAYKSYGFPIPSPLTILYKCLIIPDVLQTNAYSLASVRNILFEAFEISSNTLQSSKIGKIEYKNIKEAVKSFSSYAKKNDNISISLDNKVYEPIAHLLSILGYFHLRFKTYKELTSYFKRKNITAFLYYSSKKESSFFEFRLSPEYSQIPDYSEILNYLDGIPLAIKGAETVFHGGLRKSSDSSLVFHISGPAGIGKTSFALYLSSVLSAYNSKCLYISTEENVDDLKSKHNAQYPNFLTRTSFSPKENLFIPIKQSLKDTRLHAFSEFLNLDEGDYNTKENDICPPIIVIDNITRFISANTNDPNFFYELEEFVEICRKYKSIVLLISGEGPANDKLDYLVDISIQLFHENTDNLDKKPTRIFKLTKSRHQLARIGSHVFHLSGSKGFRISPQVPSQLDTKNKIKTKLPNFSKILPTLNFSTKNKEGDKDEVMNKFECHIYDNSQILIHGHGSSGKAGLALKILLTPPVEDFDKLHDEYIRKDKKIGGEKDSFSKFLKLKEQNEFNKKKYKRKVLTISFLYPEDYYKYLIDKKLSGINQGIFGKTLQKPVIDFEYFYPGFLNPEDFISKISRRLDEAIIYGEPYTGVLLDGLHNVFLQFPNLQERDSIWPLLYNLLRRYELTVVTTFTNFSINDKFSNKMDNVQTSLFADSEMESNFEPHMDYDDMLLMKKGQTPFLHALVQAADFYFQIEPVKSRKNGDIDYKFFVRSALSQKVPTTFLLWNRIDLLFTSY